MVDEEDKDIINKYLDKGKSSSGGLGDFFSDEFDAILEQAAKEYAEPAESGQKSQANPEKKIRKEAPKPVEKSLFTPEEEKNMELERLKRNRTAITDDINQRVATINTDKAMIESLEDQVRSREDANKLTKIRNRIKRNEKLIEAKDREFDGINQRIRDIESGKISFGEKELVVNEDSPKVTENKTIASEPPTEPEPPIEPEPIILPKPEPAKVEPKEPVSVSNKDLEDQRRKIQSNIKGHESAERQILGALLKEKDASRKTNLEKNLNRIKSDLEKYRNSLAVIEAGLKNPSKTTVAEPVGFETVKVKNESQKLDSFPEGFRESTRALIKEINRLTDKDAERMEEIVGEIEVIIDIFQKEINQVEELVELSDKKRREPLNPEELQKFKLIYLYKKEGVYNLNRELNDLYDALDFWERNKEKVDKKIKQLKEKAGEVKESELKVPIAQGETVEAEVAQELVGKPVIETSQKEPEIVFSSVSARDHFRGLGAEAKMYVLENFKQSVWDNTIDKVKFAYSEKIFNWHEKIAAKINTKNKKINDQIKALQGEKEKGMASVSKNLNNINIDAIYNAEAASANRSYLIDLEVQKLMNKKHRLEDKLFNRTTKRDAYVSRLKSLAESVKDRINWLTMPFKSRLENLDAPKETINVAVKEYDKYVKQWETTLSEMRKKISDPKYNSIKSMIKHEIELAESNLMIAKNSSTVTNLDSQLKFIEDKIKKIKGRVIYWEKVEKEFQGKVPKPADYLQLNKSA
ncbi:MAG TPA: hypothetical protein P5096_02620 [Patescibacteria group bacterium]|nr:hypothetical protein [Patescibacteria group bacterium]